MKCETVKGCVEDDKSELCIVWEELCLQFQLYSIVVHFIRYRQEFLDHTLCNYTLIVDSTCTLLC